MASDAGPHPLTAPFAVETHPLSGGGAANGAHSVSAHDLKAGEVPITSVGGELGPHASDAGEKRFDMTPETFEAQRRFE